MQDMSCHEQSRCVPASLCGRSGVNSTRPMFAAQPPAQVASAWRRPCSSVIINKSLCPGRKQKKILRRTAAAAATTCAAVAAGRATVEANYPRQKQAQTQKRLLQSPSSGCQKRRCYYYYCCCHCCHFHRACLDSCSCCGCAPSCCSCGASGCCCSSSPFCCACCSCARSCAPSCAFCYYCSCAACYLHTPSLCAELPLESCLQHQQLDCGWWADQRVCGGGARGANKQGQNHNMSVAGASLCQPHSAGSSGGCTTTATERNQETSRGSKQALHVAQHVLKQTHATCAPK